MFDVDTLVKNLNERLRIKEITPYRLAKDTGIPKETVLKIVKGKSTNPTIGNLYIIADYFECSIDELIGRDTVIKVPEIMMNEKLLAAALNIVENDLKERAGDVTFGEWYRAVRSVYMGMLDLKPDT